MANSNPDINSDKLQMAELKVLLLQIRDTQQVRDEEFQSFVSFSGLQASQFDVLNVFDTPQFDATLVHQYDAVFVGGASEASVLEPENYPFVPYCVALLRYCNEIAKPVFASCFGFQLATLALDGEIVRDSGEFEMGTLPISLTESAKDDVVFKSVPDPFIAVSVHRERAPHLPVSCELLAYTDKCPHAFKVKDKPFWAFQFHPEVDKATLVERLTIYQSAYTDSPEQLQQVIDSALDTPESNALVRSFVEYLAN